MGHFNVQPSVTMEGDEVKSSREALGPLGLNDVGMAKTRPAEVLRNLDQGQSGVKATTVVAFLQHGRLC